MKFKLAIALLLACCAVVAAQAPPVANSRSPHGPLDVPCQNCHTAMGWKPIRAVPEFDHNRTKFPLRGMHASATCTSCHVKPVFANTGTRCADCHADIHKRQLGPNCEQCHSVKGWKVQVQQIKDHNNRFPLIGAHAAVDCASCHKNGALSKYSTMPTDCYSCHASEFKNTVNPNHVGGKFPTNCSQCHSFDSWYNATFDHALTGFPLTGMHTVPPRQCADCHVNNNYNITVTTCVSCHLKDYNGATNPNHVQGGFAQTCESCHTTSAWQPATFDHAKSGFPLTGLHTVPPRQCTDCHVNNNYNITNTACVSCHQNDYNNAKTPVDHLGAKIPTTCETCHTTSGWSPANFDHAKLGFALTGMHTVPPRACTDCHVNNNYNITVTTCVSCHLNDYKDTNNPNHVQQGFSQTCETCHTTSGWSPAQFDHSKSGFPLTGLHTVPPRQCADCHVNNNYNITDTTCVSCHLKDYQGAKNPDHIAQNFPQTCEICHSTSGWSPAQYDHSKSGFPLTGLHTVPPRACTDCHVNNNYNITNTACVSCHLKDYQGAKNPDHVAGNFPQTCEVCHSTSGWSPASYDHSKTGFPLTGLHTVPPRHCTDCHVNNNYNITDTTCVSCHLKDYQGAKNPDHVAQNFPQTCEVCHSTSGWSPANFDHNKTGFPLTGQHTVPPRACTDCHINNNYNITNTTCVSCHQKDYDNAKTPVDHVGAHFPTTCESCHDTTNWMNGKFDHSSTGWTLTGMHTVPPRACTDCHINNNYNITVTTCVSCHQNDYNNAKTPVDHIAAKFSTTCENCHDTTNWMNGKFDHSSTGWTLTGMHTVPPRACTDCHVNSNYNITVTTCVSCHQNDYNNAKTPVDHVAGHFPTTCENCHDTTNWMNGKFDHSSTGWALTGSHTVPPRACTDCHINNNYNITVTTCVSCHQNDYNQAKSPVDHVGAHFPTTCESCHDTINWMDGKFDHSSTGWALTGSHTVPPRACSDCHINGNYNITVTTCVSCHQNDYNNAKSPVDHVAAKFPTTCELCHDTVAWTNGKFDHSSTGWTLTGMHTVPPRACTDCHVNGNYNITVTTCVSCHLNDYNNAKTPVDHVGAKFPTTCETCHDTVNWMNGKFDHASTGWALTGLHTVPPRACTDCHVNGNYNITTTACYSCHKADYDGTTNPNHAAAHFPTTCETCHDTTSWLNAKFDHTYFPMNHGGAKGVCATCHTNPNDYSVFQCTGCHTKSQTDPKHQGVKGYVWNSVNCYQCHKSGGGG